MEPQWQGWKKVHYEVDGDPNFVNEIAGIPGCEKILGCIQCGTCSGACPLSPYMEHSPRRLIAMVRAGFKKEVLTSSTPWLCVSCYACTVECPKEIKITDVMYALKQKALQEGIYPKGFSIPVLAREFYNQVLKQGRNTESHLTLRLFLKTNLWRLFQQIPLGLRLWWKGRMRVRVESIQGKRELTKILESLDGQREKKKKGIN